MWMQQLTNQPLPFINTIIRTIIIEIIIIEIIIIDYYYCLLLLIIIIIDIDHYIKRLL